MNAPLLSVCIPTWNRPELLELALATTVPQTEALWPLAECVVSDNGSTDATRAIADRYAGSSSFRYFRNESNLGAVRNYSLMYSERARGEFVWFIGDDDAIVPGAVARIVDVLTRFHGKLDFVAFNLLAVALEHRPTPEAGRGGVPPVGGQLARTRAREGPQPFEALLDGEGQAFTTIYSFVTRREDMARAYPPAVLSAPPYESVEATYPHAVMLAERMVGRPAYYIPEPLLNVYEWPVAAYSWAPYVPVVGTVRYAELLRRYMDRGVPMAQLEPYFREVVSNARGLLPRLLWDRTAAGGIGALRRLFEIMPCCRRELAAAVVGALRDERAPMPVRKASRASYAAMLGVKRLLGVGR